MRQTRLASICFACTLASLYVGALFAASFCRGGRVLGRELLEAVRERRHLGEKLRESGFCEVFQGTDLADDLIASLHTAVFPGVGTEDSIAFLQTTVSVHRRAESS